MPAETSLNLFCPQLIYCCLDHYLAVFCAQCVMFAYSVLMFACGILIFACGVLIFACGVLMFACSTCMVHLRFLFCTSKGKNKLLNFTLECIIFS